MHETTGHKLDNSIFRFEPRREFETLRHVARSLHVFTRLQKGKRDTKLSLHPAKHGMLARKRLASHRDRRSGGNVVARRP
jgi:hypothetical protein